MAMGEFTGAKSAQESSNAFNAFIGRCQRVLEAAGVVMFTIMFGAIMLQVVSRYMFNRPLGWTDEITMVGFVWVAFWSAACVIRIRKHATFDLVYHHVSAEKQRLFSIVGLLIPTTLLLLSIPDTVSYFVFLSFQKTGVLEISYRIVFFTYFVFVLVFPLRAIRRLYSLYSSDWRSHI